MQVAVNHRAAQPLSQDDGVGHRVAHDHAAARNHDRELSVGQHLGRRVQAVVTARASI